MGPLSFLNGAFLAALAAAALPVLIHLFSRRRARQVPFGQLRFLEEITRRKVRRMQLRQWLLLALRTLAIALLALALSRPVWHGAGAQTQRGSSTVAILIDDSFSLEAQLDASGVLPVDRAAAGLRAVTRFDEARQRAQAIVDLLGEGDRALLVFLGHPLRVPFENSVRDPALLREELARAAPRPTRADLRGGVERVAPVLQGAHTLNKEIFLISDFQRAQIDELLESYAGRPTPADSGATPALLPIPPETNLYLLPTSARGVANVAVLGARFERDPAGVGGRLSVALRNLGETPAHEVALQIRAGEAHGPLLAEGLVTVEPGATVRTQLALPDVPADGRITVRGGPDLLARDDIRYIVTGAAQRFRVLLVTGGELADPEIAAETRFVRLALDPWSAGEVSGAAAGSAAERSAGAAAGTGSGGEALFAVTAIAEADLGLVPRIEADVVVLLNAGRLSAAAAERLEQFHHAGGGVLIALGDRVDPRLYNTQVLPRLGGLRLENILGDPEAEGHFTLRPAAVGHAIFEGFPIAPGGALSGARFKRIVRVRPGPEARVLAEFSGGHAALVAEPGLLLFASSLDMRWSDFPAGAAYLPFLHRLLQHLLLGAADRRHAQHVGDPLHWPLPEGMGSARFVCEGPDGSSLPLEIIRGERGATLQSAPVASPGFYRLRAGEGPLASTHGVVAVNVDTRESDLHAASPAARELLFGGAAHTIEPGDEIGREVREARYGRELWRLCLLLAFLALVTESLLARSRLLG